MTQLQTEIKTDEWVRKVFSWQKPDGWIGRDFHGEKGMETGIRVLCEKGVEKSHPVITKALQALSNEDDKRMLRGIGKVGTILDDRNLGGTKMIRAAVFAYAGFEDLPFIQEQIKLALHAFEAVTSVKSVDEITEIYKGKRVFLSETIWPSIYHLRLLALTHGWRSEDNQLIISNAINRLVQLSPIPYILVRHKSQLIAPASFCMLDFNPDIGILDDSGWMMWFHRMELLARLGITHLVPELQDQIARLKILLAENQGTFELKVNHYYFRKWSSYSGLMLEKDWRDPQRRKNDLTFRSLLILHH
jgi:hypothetical protein